MDETKSQAYLVWAEWGPPGLIAREERLAQCFPQIASDERAVWLREFNEIESFVWQVAENGAFNSCSDDDFKAAIQAAFPFLNEAAVSKAWFLARYYAWHG